MVAEAVDGQKGVELEQVVPKKTQNVKETLIRERLL